MQVLRKVFVILFKDTYKEMSIYKRSVNLHRLQNCSPCKGTSTMDEYFALEWNSCWGCRKQAGVTCQVCWVILFHIDNSLLNYLTFWKIIEIEIFKQ